MERSAQQGPFTRRTSTRH